MQSILLIVASILMVVASFYVIPFANADNWKKIYKTPLMYEARRGHSSVRYQDLFVFFGGRHTFFDNLTSVIDAINIHWLPGNKPGDWLHDDFVCPYGCFGNGDCILPGLASKVVNLNVTKGAQWWVANNPIEDAIVSSKCADSTNFRWYKVKGDGECGTCVCMEGYSGPYCQFLESDHFNNDLTYFNATAGSWWSRTPIRGTNEFKDEPWPNVRNFHTAVLMQAGVPMSDNTTNGTVVLWELNEIQAKEDWAKRGGYLYNSSLFLGPRRPMMVIYGGFSPGCGDYCSDVWIWDFGTHALALSS